MLQMHQLSMPIMARICCSHFLVFIQYSVRWTTTVTMQRESAIWPSPQRNITVSSAYATCSSV